VVAAAAAVWVAGIALALALAVTFPAERKVQAFSRTVTTFLKNHPGERTLVGLWEGLRPNYIVARRKEIERARAWLPRDYELVRVFRVPLDEATPLYRAERNMDLQFTVFRKK